MKSLNVTIFTLGNKTYGFGHKVRSMALKVVFEKFWKVRIIDIENWDHNLSGLEVSDVFLFDLPAKHENIYTLVSKFKGKKIAFDYFEKLPFDLVISVFEHFGILPGKRKSGLEYVIIRDEIKNLTKIIQENYVFISLGGADIHQKSQFFSSQVSQLGLKGKLILGQAAQEPAIENLNIEVYRTPEQFPELIGNCEWGITNGGGTMLEMIYLKKPVYVFPQTTLEDNLAKELRKKNVIMGIYPEDKLAPPLTNQLNETLIDGKGPYRIAELIEEIS